MSQFNINIEDALQENCRNAAAQKGITLTKWTIGALQAALAAQYSQSAGQPSVPTFFIPPPPPPYKEVLPEYKWSTPFTNKEIMKYVDAEVIHECRAKLQPAFYYMNDEVCESVFMQIPYDDPLFLDKSQAYGEAADWRNKLILGFDSAKESIPKKFHMELRKAVRDAKEINAYLQMRGEGKLNPTPSELEIVIRTSDKDVFESEADAVDFDGNNSDTLLRAMNRLEADEDRARQQRKLKYTEGEQV